MTLPNIIALCGKPLSGKSTAAELLQEIHGYTIVDDGLPLRKIAVDYLGLTWEQVSTQEGKLETVWINGRSMTVREILGEIGNAFEEKFGGDVIPLMSYNLMVPGGRYVLGSVRREQGHFWSSKNAVVVEIDNPEAEVSRYEFDRYSKKPIDHTVLNDGPAEGLHPDDSLLRLISRLEEALGL